MYQPPIHRMFFNLPSLVTRHLLTATNSIFHSHLFCAQPLISAALYTV